MQVSSSTITPKNDFQMEPINTSSVHYSHTKSEETKSFDLYPAAFTFKSDSALPTKQEAADNKCVTNGPPSYSSLYS